MTNLAEMTLDTLTGEMRRYNMGGAPGSECAAWQDYHADCYSVLGHGPSDDAHADDIVPEDFATYWYVIASSSGGDVYDEAGQRLSDMDDD